jgi:hypothetical protein
MKKIILLLILGLSIPAFSQSINDYQNVIVPIKFDILKENDRYRLNTLTKLMLQKYGFKSYLSTDEMNDEVSNNRCAILYASLVADNGFFSTKIKVVLKDCKDKVIYETDFGSSREKEYAVAYNQALREAFKSFDKLNYKYNGKNEGNPTSVIPTVPEIPSTPVVEMTSQNSEKSPEIFLFAQPLPNGFQIVDSEPKIVMRLFNTSEKNVFIGVKGNTNGVVIFKNNQWFFEYYENSKMVSELLKLKF